MAIYNRIWPYIAAYGHIQPYIYIYIYNVEEEEEDKEQEEEEEDNFLLQCPNTTIDLNN